MPPKNFRKRSRGAKLLRKSSRKARLLENLPKRPPINIRTNIGSRAQVWHGFAKKTSGGLQQPDLVMNLKGRVVSMKKFLWSNSTRNRHFQGDKFTLNRFVKKGKSGRHSPPYSDRNTRHKQRRSCFYKLRKRKAAYSKKDREPCFRVKR